MRTVVMKTWAWGLLLWLVSANVADAAERGEPRADVLGIRPQTAHIHWKGVPLRDAVARLEQVFGGVVMVDRRIDPSQRVSLDMDASGGEEVLARIAAPRELEVSRLGRLVYLGPREAASRLRPLAALRTAEAAPLAASRRAALERKESFRWPRLSRPRELAASLVQQRGWRLAEEQRIPHDLWPAGELPEMPLAEQLTVLLLGFDLTFEWRPRERVVEIVPVDAAAVARLAEGAKSLSQNRPRRGEQAHFAPRTSQNEPVPDGSGIGSKPRAIDNQPPRPSRRMGSEAETRRLYTLRVEQQPVRAVLEEIARRLKWRIEIDESAIREAGRSVEKRVSFAVENVEQDELLDALLRPAGLRYRRDGERIKIVPRGDGR